MRDDQLSHCYPVTIVSDSIPEEEECFIISVSLRDAPSGASLNPRLATVCINDDDGMCCFKSVPLLNTVVYILTATPVRIGLQQTMYSVLETNGYQVVCAEVQSGDIAGQTIELNYSTTSGTALGILLACGKLFAYKTWQRQ